MGRAEERRARQRGGRRAAPGRRRSSGAAGGGKSGIRRLFTWKKILGTFLGLCLLGIGAFVVLYMMIDIPEGNADATRQSNIYKYSDGTVMSRQGKVNRELVDLSHVPKKVQYTFVAAENKTFYKDNGVDLKGTARGLLNTLSGKGAQGGSTITQQYVKNYYLTQEQTVTRKLRELVISLKLDREKSKDYILAGYINTSYYGRNAYGIQAAAQAYYGVDADKLTVAQGAYLAALLQAPSQYDWAVASAEGRKLVTARWNYVLDNMVEEGWLDKADRDAMKFPEPQKPKPAPGLGGQKGYLVEAANQELERQLVAQGVAENKKQAEDLVGRGGWTITLNIDRKKQAALEKAAKDQLTGKLDAKRPDDQKAQAGAVSVDPKTGAVVAMYGGKDYFDHYTNNATRTDFQPASTFKPVVLAAALDQGAETQDGEPIRADTYYDGTSRRQVVDHGRKVGFAPQNEDDTDFGDITVQTAMNYSVNSVFAQLGVDVGMSKVLATGEKLGMDTKKLQPVPAQTLGTMGASPLQMAGVYATLDNHGKKVTPAVVKDVQWNKGTLDLPDPIGDQVISREAADTVTSVLTGVVDDGTARGSVRNNPERHGQKVAGKTGTAENNVTAWFSGYTPGLVTAVGVFGEMPKPPYGHVSLHKVLGKPRINGGDVPAKIWAEYMFGVQKKVTEFDLETKQGAAVEPADTPTPSESPSDTGEPSQSPSQTESPTQQPSPTEEPSQSPSQTESPSQTPSGTPSESPGQPSGSPSGSPQQSPANPLGGGGTQ
ncbi:transglycosylase domain-containing protein [Streptomyces sp. MS06]|uniref:transglycosylase domain-containing protein n=1 Tax=Streptomyces sp. MS06 TaxID=3385974 RepID=UPI0039A068EB